MREPMVRFSSPDRMFAMMPGKSLCNLRTRLGEQERPPLEGNAPRPSVRKVGICDRRQRQPHLRAAPHLLSQCASAVRRGTIVRTCAPNQRRRHDQRLQQIVPHQRLFFCGAAHARRPERGTEQAGCAAAHRR